jgi:hypothetical protein
VLLVKLIVSHLAKKLDYSVEERLPYAPILNHTNSVEGFPIDFFKTHFNIIFLSTP